MSASPQESFRIGKLEFTPFIRQAENGRYRAGLSIKRGQNSATHARVSVYTPTFQCTESALTYARQLGHQESTALTHAA